jgi:acyl carrier protein
MKLFIIRSLGLEGVDAGMIGDDDPLFGGELGLDSVDALELVVALEKEFGIKIKSHEVEPEVFASAASLSHYVQQRLAAGEGPST